MPWKLSKHFTSDSPSDAQVELQVVREYADGRFDLCATDAIVKARYKRSKTGQYLSLSDPFDIELSLVNNFALVGDTCNLHIKGHVLKGIYFLW